MDELLEYLKNRASHITDEITDRIMTIGRHGILRVYANEEKIYEGNDMTTALEYLSDRTGV